MMRSLAIVCLLAAAFAACGGSSSRARTYSGSYLSLGDSIAAGNGASDPATTSFAALLAHDEGVPVKNLAVAGSTSQDLIDNQLPVVVGQKMKLAFITISIGGYDLAALIPNASCEQDPLPDSCPLDDALKDVQKNVDEILKTLRHAYPDTPIVLLLYPNFFSGTGTPFEAPAGRVLPKLDQALEDVAARYDHTAVATTAAAFEGKGGTLTHVLDIPSDPHPTDPGHRLIADAFIDALERVR